MKRPRSGVASAAKVRVDETADTQPMDPALLMDLPSTSAEPLLPVTGEGNDSTVPPPFELDENTMRSLQQFIDAQGFQSPPNQSADEQSPVVAGVVPQNNTTSALAEDLAQYFLPSKEDVKPETEEERKARRERVKMENRERKKRWRDQNRDRNKDNDLRCRVNKRASLIFGAHSSPEKTRYIEDEFKKRKFKRRGRDFSPTPEASRPWYSDVVNTSDFANVIMQLLVARGLDPHDPDSIQLVEMLQKDPKSIEKFGLTLAPEPPEEEMEEMEEEKFDPNLQQMLPQERATFEGFETTYFPVANQIQPYEDIPIPPQDQSFIMNEAAILSPPSTSAPIPMLDVKIEEVESKPIASTKPRKRAIIGPPAYIPRAVPNQTQTIPSKERIRAMGFPPAISPPPQ